MSYSIRTYRCGFFDREIIAFRRHENPSFYGTIIYFPWTAFCFAMDCKYLQPKAVLYAFLLHLFTEIWYVENITGDEIQNFIKAVMCIISFCQLLLPEHKFHQ
jgi:hypothetical protein